MQTKGKLKKLKVVLIVIAIIFLIVLLFYLTDLLPKYLACDEHKNETNIGIDIWGNQIDCDGLTNYYAEKFFQFSSVIVGIFSIVTSLLTYYYFKLRKINQ